MQLDYHSDWTVCGWGGVATVINFRFTNENESDRFFKLGLCPNCGENVYKHTTDELS